MAAIRPPTTPRPRSPPPATTAFASSSSPSLPPPHFTSHGQLTPRTRRFSHLQQHFSNIPIRSPTKPY